jgi:hypothetical protein
LAEAFSAGLPLAGVAVFLTAGFALLAAAEFLTGFVVFLILLLGICWRSLTLLIIGFYGFRPIAQATLGIFTRINDASG